MPGMNLYTKFRLQMNPSAVLRQGKRFSSRYTAGVGAFVMTAARQSIRPAGKKARPVPGRPPRSHVGKGGFRGIKEIYFDAGPDSVIIGPVALSTQADPGPTGARLLEEGGTRVHRWPGGRRKTQRYRAFPYMGPAFKKGVADYNRKMGSSAATVSIGPGSAVGIGP